MKQQIMSFVKALLAVTLVLALPAMAQGLDKANESAEMVIDILNGVSIAVGTIAFMWVGYRVMFKKAEMSDMGRIVIGALIFGGAPQVAVFFMS